MKQQALNSVKPPSSRSHGGKPPDKLIPIPNIKNNVIIYKINGTETAQFGTV
jgi:hypothetical protein